MILLCKNILHKKIKSSIFFSFYILLFHMENKELYSLIFFIVDVIVMVVNFQLRRGSPYGQYKIVNTVTKILLLPSLLLFYLINTKSTNTFVLLYLIIHFIADNFVIYSRKYNDILTSCAYALGHFLLCFCFKIYWENVNYIAFVVPIATIALELVYVVPRINLKGNRIYSILAYIVILNCALFYASARTSTLGITSLKYWAGLIGYLLFISVECHYIRRFLTVDPNILYPAAQFCIILSVMN